MTGDPISLAVGAGIARELAERAFADIAVHESRPTVGLIRQLRAEINAVRGTPSTTDGRIRDSISGALRRIAGESHAQARLARALEHLGSHAVTASSVLSDPEVRACLQDNDLQRDLVDIALRALVIGQIDHSAPEFGRAVALCAAKIQRSSGFPEFLVDFVTSVVIASVTSGLSFEESLNLAAVQHVSQQVSRVEGQLEELGNRMGGFGMPLATAECRRILDRAVIFRFQNPESATAQIVDLARRVIRDGDLTGAEPSMRAEVLYWAARLSEGRNKDRALSEYFLTQLTNTGIETDRRIIEALRLKNDGKPDAAQALLSEVGSADANSVLLSQLAEHRGVDAVVSWVQLHAGLQPPDLVPAGWAQVAMAYATQQEFDRAIQVISALGSKELESFPQLLLLRGRCMARASFPSDAWDQLGTHALHSVNAPPLQTSEARNARDAAIPDFAAAERAFEKLGFEPGVRIARAEIAWCLVKDPIRRTEASETIRANLDVLEFAAPFLELADRSGISVDTTSLDRQVGLRLLSGGLRTGEIGTYIALLRHKKDYRELAKYLSENAQQLRSLPFPGDHMWALFLWEALMDAGETERARTHLDENRDSFGTSYERCLAIITEKAGEDPIPLLRKKYASSRDPLDLANLCIALRNRGDLVSLEVMAEELVRARPTPDYLAMLCECYFGLNKPKAALELLDSHATTVQNVRALRHMRASALYVLGRFSESTSLAEELLGERHSSEALRFAIQSAVLSGDLQVVRRLVRRELDKGPIRSSEDLRLLATVCDIEDQATALEIAKQNVAAAPNDPAVLTAAYTLAIKLGREEVGHEWLMRAAELSAPTDGPVIRKSLKETIEYVRERGEATNRIWSLVANCEVPLQLALARTNRTLSEVIIGGGLGQLTVRDPRKRGLIPLGHGGHRRTDLSDVQNIGIDVGSLLLAQALGILGRVLQRFSKVVLPWSVFWFLYREKQQNGFHQPSQLQKGRDALSFSSNVGVGVVESVEAATSWLPDEVGQELGSLLARAEKDSGVVIGPAKPMKAMSLGETPADIKQYADRLASIRDLIVFLRHEGAISNTEESKALAYIAAVEPESGARALVPTSTMQTGPLFLTELAVTYLQFLGLLDRMRTLGRPLFVHRTAIDEWHAVVDFGARADATASELDALWASLLSARDSGRAVLLPSLTQSEHEEDSDGTPQPLMELMSDVRDMQALWLDDRSLAGMQTVTDRKGLQRPLVNVLDVIRELRRSGQISMEDSVSALLELRRFGYYVFPLDEEELTISVAKANGMSEQGVLVETADLRTLRQYVARLRSTTFLKLPAEGLFLAELKEICLKALRTLWQGSTDSDKLVRAKADWIVKWLYPFAIDWRHTISNAGSVSWADVGAAELAQLIVASPTTTNRVPAFREWYAETVVREERKAPGVGRALGQLLSRGVGEELVGESSSG